MFAQIKNVDLSDKLSALMLFVLVFIAQSAIAYIWHTKNVLTQYDIIFDTDPIRWFISFADGWGPEHAMHPLGNYLIAGPIRMIQIIGSILGLVDDGASFRKLLTIYVSPFFTALKAICFYSIFRLLNFDYRQSLIITGVAALSFSSVVFGSVPSSYPLVGFGYTLLTLCTLLILKNETRNTRLAFYLASIFSIGMTCSSVIYVGWMKWFEYLAKGLKPLNGLFKSIKISFVILVGVLIMFFVLNMVNSALREQPPSHAEIENVKNMVKKYSPPIEIQLTKAIRFPEFVTRTIIPTVPINHPTTDLHNRTDPIKVELSYLQKKADIFSIFYAIAAIIVVGGGAYIALKQKGLWRPLAISTIASLGTFWLFFSWFGLGIYLYSQNWYVPCILLMSSWLKIDFFNSNSGRIVLIFMLLMLLAGDIYVLESITQRFVPFHS